MNPFLLEQTTFHFLLNIRTMMKIITNTKIDLRMVQPHKVKGKSIISRALKFHRIFIL